jgi:hypothetical protein
MAGKETERRRRSVAAASQRKREAGMKQGTFWFSVGVQARLERLAQLHGTSKEQIVHQAILAYPAPPLRYEQRIVWRSPTKPGVTRRGIVRQIAIDPKHRGEVEILFDDADDPDAREWRLQEECEPE